MIKQNSKIKKLRNKIDKIDNKIFKLLIKRFETVKEIAKLKKALKIKLRDKSREKEILIRANNFSQKYSNYLQIIYKCIIKSSIKLQK